MSQARTTSEYTDGPTAPGDAAWRRLDSEHGFADPLIEQIAFRFRLLGEPLRLKLMAALSGGERSVGELVELTGAGQPNVSKHLAALAQGGLVHRRKAGLVALYSIADPLVLRLCDVLCAGVQEGITRQARALGIELSPQMTSQPQTNNK
ncbi:MAG TPA: metalloregulator ArsR/SmtB family transcription factor [Ktedonobacterales bacterium]|nr:metalloregulator ArsR/SmtB family transcription factor [Ktedonobacterales bacterium]